MFNYQTRNSSKCFVAVAIILIIVNVFITSQPSGVECAPTTKNGNTKNINESRSLRASLRNLFRRHQSTKDTTTSASTTTTTTSNGPSDSEAEEAQSQTEIDAHKFMDSLPSTGSNSGPTTLRERMSDTLGVLRDGVSNHFRSIRDNFSETVDDLRDTWTSSE